MRFFLIAALYTGLAYAKPQYNYPAPPTPSGSYGVPAGAGGVFGQSGFTQTVGGFSQTGSSFSQSGEGYPSRGCGEGLGLGGGSTSCYDQHRVTAYIAIPSMQKTGNFSQKTLAAAQGYISSVPRVQKHIYVHVAPPEPEEVRPQRPISAGQATKHYKIIFIKAPSYQTYQQLILQQQAQNEEKTLVYVLVKKPDEQADITIPTAAPTAPSKPEVYFIRYKAKSEVTGGGATGSQLSGGGAGLGGSASLSFSSASSASSQFNTASSLNLSTGDSSSFVSATRPQTNYGPPGQSGPY